MATKILQWIDNLFERNPEMIEQKVSINLMRMTSLHYWGGHNEALDLFEETTNIARREKREDLEIEILNHHISMQKQRYGGIENVPKYQNLDNRIKELESRINN